MSQVVKWLEKGGVISVEHGAASVTSVRVVSVGPDGWIKGMVTFPDMEPGGWKDTDEMVYVNLNNVSVVSVETEETETNESTEDEATE